jgi:feruloyl esterase
MALMEAQRYPDDYDGIIAGSLANRHIHMWTAGVARSIDLSRHPRRRSPPSTPTLRQQHREQVRHAQGGFLNNPRRARWTSPRCAARRADAGQLVPHRAAAEDGRDLLRRREELQGRADLLGQALGNPIGAHRPAPTGTGRHVRPRAHRLQRSERRLAEVRSRSRHEVSSTRRSATSTPSIPICASSSRGGGKLLLSHGWSDTGITPETTIWYYDRVLDKMGSKQSDWMRLFMVPGMGHCGGGPGITTFDSIGTLEQWVEKGVAPDTMLGKGAQGMTRPLCPYPQTAEYSAAAI